MTKTGNSTVLSPFLKLVEIEGKGRGIVASESLKAGQIVLRDTPSFAYFVAPLKDEEDETNISERCCAHCYRHLEGKTTIATCPSCSHPRDGAFCNAKCLWLAQTSTHTPWVCQTLTYLRNCPLLVDHQIAARCLVAVFNLAMVSPSAFQKFLSLDGCGDHHKERYYDAAVYLHSVFSQVPFLEGSTLAFPSVELMADILAKDWRSQYILSGSFFEESEEKRHVRAYAIYPKASFVNHSCLPNAAYFNYSDSTTDIQNTDMVFRAMKDILPGEEICISYWEVNMSYSQRKKWLMDFYTITCSCDRCKVEGKLGGGDDFGFVESYMKTFMCEREVCRGFMAPLTPSDDGRRSGFMECSYCGTLTERKDQV